MNAVEDEGFDSYIRQHCPWERLPAAVRQSFENSRELWEREVRLFSLKNQLRWKTSLVRKFFTDERKYYEDLLATSKEYLMLFPYHLSDVLIRGLHITPFQYYVDIMHDLMSHEKSYDSLPNFTAKDCLCLLGIGRNEYIELMNRSKSAMRNGLWNLVMRRKTTAIMDLLPTQPIEFRMEPWWIVCYVGASEEVLKQCSEDEQILLRHLVKHKTTLAGEYNHDVVQSVHKKGLIYLDVPIQSEDYVSVPPLEGFVMNRVLGDYFETLLYKIFVSIDETTNIAELSNVLQIDVQMVKDAVSVYCRLGFAIKKNIELADRNGRRIQPHISWQAAAQKRALAPTMAVEYEILAMAPGRPLVVQPTFDDDEEEDEALPDSDSAEDGVAVGRSIPVTPIASSEPYFAETSSRGAFDNSMDNRRSTSLTSSQSPSERRQSSSNNNEMLTPPGVANPQQNFQQPRRIGFLFDATLTAFLMMGNLSLGLKSHAVTMFEVGKLANESLDSFLEELAKVKRAPLSEGDAQRYFDHAVTLYRTLRFLRGEPQDPGDEDLVERHSRLPPGSAIDLIRYESLSSLDAATRQRVLGKNYEVLLSMAPIAADCRTLRSSIPSHLGPPIPEVNSMWFKLFVYSVVGSGPPTIVLSTGTRLRFLPEIFQDFDELLLTSWDHEPQVLSTTSILVTLNDLLCDGPVTLQGYRYKQPMLSSPSKQQEQQDGTVRLEDKSEEAGNATSPITMDVPFPFLPSDAPEDNTRKLLERLTQELHLDCSCGYVRLLRLYQASTQESKSVVSWVPLDVCFGVPLFDGSLNAKICQRIAVNGLLNRQQLRVRHSRHMRQLSLRLLSFMAAYQSSPIPSLTAECAPYPSENMAFENGQLSLIDMERFSYLR